MPAPADPRLDPSRRIRAPRGSELLRGPWRVSASSVGGGPLATVEPLVTLVTASGKLRVVDIAEINPLFDRDGQIVRTAARLVARFVCGFGSVSYNSRAD